jgi:TPR repeat protein
MRSLVELANIYRNGGYGVSIDIPRMYRCYQELADHDIAEGNYYIGLAYLYGLNNYQLNSDKAIPMIKEAADKRFLPAMVLYGIMEFCSYQKRKKEADKTEVANRIAASESRLMDALNAGGSTPEFYYYIGKAYSLGVISPGVNQEKALEYFKKSADLGDPKGKNALGFYYMNGLGGLTKDANKALELFTYAANRLLAASEYNLYTLYLYGAPGIEKNTKLQQYWHDRYLVNTNKSIDQLPTNTTNEIY